MRKHKRCLTGGICLLAGAILFAAPVFAGEGNDYVGSLPQAKIDLIQENIVLALNSNSPQMQGDAAQLVRDIRELRPGQSFGACVNPLMGILKNEDADPAARILAALALDDLDCERGLFAISRTAQFTDQPRVKYICTWLTYDRKSNKHDRSKDTSDIEPLEEFSD